MIKKTSIALFIIAIAFIANAQIQNPVHWAYGLKHVQGQQYEVHLQATIDDGWHIYAQKQGKDFIGTRTKIKLEKIPGMTLVGGVKEIGTKETYTDPNVGITNIEYAGKVDFVQEVNIAPGLKQIKGAVTYQTCTRKQCLSAETLNFSVPVN